MSEDYRGILAEGLWRNNIAVVQILGLCPMMAVTTTATNGLGMGLATAGVLVASNAVIAGCRDYITQEVRIPVFILLIAAMVSLVDLTINAWLHELYKVLGLFIPLIVANCALLGRAEAFASRQPVLASALDGLAMGLGYTLALTLIGACREMLGSATLFAHASLLLGDGFAFLETTLIPNYKGFLLMLLPPGGFLVVGFLLASKRAAERRWEQRAASRGKAQTGVQQSPSAA